MTADFHPDAERAWASTELAGALDEDLRRELMRTAVYLEVPAGETIYQGTGSPRLALIINGLARVLVSSIDGRRATVRYVRPGEFTGMVSVVTQRQAVDSEAVSDSAVLFMDVDLVRRIAATNARLAWVIAQDVGTVTSEVIDIAATNVFGSVRRRVAWHLLDLAQATGSGLMVRVNQQDLADSIGSVREVVARSLRGLREDGIIGPSSAEGIAVLDASALHEVAAERG